MAKAVKHTVTFPDGTTQTRRSPRTYLYAIIGRGNQAAAQDRAYNYDAHQDAVEKRNFAWYSGIAATGKWEGSRGDMIDADEKLLATAKAAVVGGFEGYAERLRQGKIESFEREVKRGAFKWTALRWSQSAHAATNALRHFNGYPHLYQDVTVVEVKRAE